MFPHEFQKGYTIFELIVVISLIGTLFIFIIPGFKNFIIENDTSALSVKIAGKIKELKRRSLIEQKNYFLKYDRSRKILFTTFDGMKEEDEKVAKEKGINIEFGFEIDSSNKDNFIGFYREGFSDSSIIKIFDGEKSIKIIVKPLIISPEIIIS